MSAIVRAQWKLVREFLSDARFRTPILLIWVASFGGALHAPVTAYYYLELGAKETDIGHIGVLINLSGLLLSPLYGFMMDTYGPYYILCLATTLCSLGCLIRGMASGMPGLFAGALLLGLGAAQIWTVVLAYLAANTGPERRSSIVSGYLTQEAALRLLGKSLFAPFDAFLRQYCGVTDLLLRMRIEMGCCTAFCFWGLLLLICDGGGMRKASQAQLEVKYQASAQCTEKFDAGGTAERMEATAGENALRCEQQVQQPSQQLSDSLVLRDRPESDSNASGNVISYCSFGTACCVLVIQGFAATTIGVLWPLFVKDCYHWGAPEYAWLILLSSSASISTVAACSSLERRWGRFHVAVGTCICCAASVSGFFIHGEGVLARLVHAVLGTLFSATVALLEPCVKSIASLYMPNILQGRSFGIMTAFCSAGSILGNIVGTRLYRIGKERDSVFNIMSSMLGAQHMDSAGHHVDRSSKESGSGIALPFVVAAALLMCGGAALALISRSEVGQWLVYESVGQTDLAGQAQAQADEVSDAEGMELTSLAPPHAIDDPDFRVRGAGKLRIRRQVEGSTNI